MSADPAVLELKRADRHPASIIARETARHGMRSAALWGVAFGTYVSISALGYVANYKTTAQRDGIAQTFGANVGINAIIGPAHEIQTVAGFTAWRSLGVLSIVGAVWGLLQATKSLRGEEDAGRWEIMLAGQTTRRGAAGQGITGLTVDALITWMVTAVIVIAVGQSSEVHIGAGASLYLATALVASMGIFLAVGALASQLAPTRRQAASYAGIALGLAYALRMVADSGTSLSWLRWMTPLGWVEELQPLTAPRPLMLVPIVGLVVALSGVTVYLAGRRDLGASTIADRVRPKDRTRLLAGPGGLTVRLVRSAAIGWTIAIALAGLMMGLIAKSAGAALMSSTRVRQLFSTLGAHGGGPSAYLGVAFLIVAVLVALVAAEQISAARGEEATGRLDHLLVRETSRTWWYVGRLLVAIVVLAVAGLAAGLSAWAGAAAQASGVGLVSLLAAGINLVPPAVLLLGIGALVLGWAPRAAPGAVYALLAWSFLVELIGGIVGINHWLLDTSVFHQMAAAPATSPDWFTSGILVGLGAVAALLGGIGFRHRDLAEA